MCLSFDSSLHNDRSSSSDKWFYWLFRYYYFTLYMFYFNISMNFASTIPVKWLHNFCLKIQHSKKEFLNIQKVFESQQKSSSPANFPRNKHWVLACEFSECKYWKWNTRYQLKPMGIFHLRMTESSFAHFSWLNPPLKTFVRNLTTEIICIVQKYCFTLFVHILYIGRSVKNIVRKKIRCYCQIQRELHWLQKNADIYLLHWFFKKQS